MRYNCMSFGWYQELLTETQVDGFAAAEAKLLELLDCDGMIVHAYRESDAENPELVGRHRRLRSFIGAEDPARLPHEIERFLIDPAGLEAWSQASGTGGLLEQRWSVVDFWRSELPGASSMYGRALLVAAPTAKLSLLRGDHRLACWL